jgi:site-specific recombinase XerD
VAIIKDTALFKLIRDYFKVYLPNQRSLSAHTIRSYRTAMDSFLDFVKAANNVPLHQVTFKMLNSQTLSDYLDGIERNGCAVSTRNLRLSCVRAFFSYAADMDCTTTIYKSEVLKVPIKKSKDKSFVKHMSENAVKVLLEQPNPATKKGLRNQFIMLLMYDTAARVGEITQIRICDLRLGETPTIMLHGKGNKIRTVPLMKQAVVHFKNYLTVYHPGESEYSQEYLFYTTTHGQKVPMNESTIRKMIAAFGIRAKECCHEVPDSVHPHLLRHSRAMHLYQHGMDLTLVSQWLGHAQFETSLIYAYADTEKKRKAIEKATVARSPLRSQMNSDRYVVDDEEMLKQLYGLR